MSKSLFTTLALIAGALVISSASATPAVAAAGDKAAIAAVMSAYNKALNDSSVDESLALYADDGVFMPPYSQSAVGKAAVREAYVHVFKTIRLHVKFTIDEIVQMSPTWAIVRTNSAGTNTNLATGKVTAEGNQELFLFRKAPSGAWRIARYSFSPTSPPQA